MGGNRCAVPGWQFCQPLRKDKQRNRDLKVRRHVALFPDRTVHHICRLGTPVLRAGVRLADRLQGLWRGALPRRLCEHDHRRRPGRRQRLHRPPGREIRDAQGRVLWFCPHMPGALWVRELPVLCDALHHQHPARVRRGFFSLLDQYLFGAAPAGKIRELAQHGVEPRRHGGPLYHEPLPGRGRRVERGLPCPGPHPDRHPPAVFVLPRQVEGDPFR